MECIELYDYQQDMKERIGRAFMSCRSVMVQMPTGTGKTYLLAAVVSEYLSCDKGTVWIITHRRELVSQIENTMVKFSMGGDGRVVVLSIQWLSRHWESVKSEPRLVIIDEAHHAVADTYKEMWRRWPRARFLGLTATPCRMNRVGFTDLFDILITSWSIAEFIERGYLSVFDYVSIRHGSEEQRLIASLEKRGADGDYQIKEMDGVLNRNTSIARLYASIERFARGKKGIVYAISIAHARHIAEYYSSHGVSAVPIDSKTPSAERRQIVDGFKSGKIKVLVNVDIFSEGFDCPDVEFVQMARPTLSLSKYLQQVGRGLRKTRSKETCVLIDNVGLYRVFGLPTVVWDWYAMFRGVVPGKSRLPAEVCRNDMVLSEQLPEESAHDCDMEVIIAHEQLRSEIGRMKEAPPVPAAGCELKSWQDVASGLWGLKRGIRETAAAQFVTVFDIMYDMASVRFKDNSCGIVSENGEVVWSKSGCRSVKFIKNRLLHVVAYNMEYYVDMYSQRIYRRRPKVRTYGNIELLETDHVYYSRTKKVYVNSQGIGRHFIHWRKFYLMIHDEKLPFPNYHSENLPPECHSGFACILDGDYESYYWLFYKLADGSIIVMDNDRKYYHVVEGQPKKYIGSRNSDDEWDRCRAEIERMARHAKETWHVFEAEQAENRRRLLAQSDMVMPFQSGMKWGLKVGNRVTVPPVYRNIKSPVGKYCAVEKNYSQWGVVALDGTVMVPPQYSDIEISKQGIVTGTKITGSKVSVKLP